MESRDNRFGFSSDRLVSDFKGFLEVIGFYVVATGLILWAIFS